MYAIKGYIPTPKKRGHTNTAQPVPKAGTNIGNIHALNINSSEKGA